MGLHELLLHPGLWAAVAGLILLTFIFKYGGLVLSFSYLLKYNKRRDTYKEGIVYLHHFPHCWTRQVPNMSPYSIKVETWLRLNKIKYEIVETFSMSKSTQQIPYVVFNGREISESNNIISELAEHFGIDMTEGLTNEQLATSRLLARTLDEATSWTIFIDRYVYKLDKYSQVFEMVPVPRWLQPSLISDFKKRITERFTKHGIARQERHIVEKAGIDDVRAIADFLGKKKFLMGEKITTVDCVVFGHLCQVAFVDFTYFHKTALSPALRDYLGRVRDALWPDWSTRVNPAPFYR